MTDKLFDPDAVQYIARDLGAMADDIEEAACACPSGVDAGALSVELSEGLAIVLDAVAEPTGRLRASSDSVRMAAYGHGEAEAFGAHTLGYMLGWTESVAKPPPELRD
jgi:hypothetical protein